MQTIYIKASELQHQCLEGDYWSVWKSLKVTDLRVWTEVCVNCWLVWLHLFNYWLYSSKTKGTMKGPWAHWAADWTITGLMDVPVIRFKKKKEVSKLKEIQCRGNLRAWSALKTYEMKNTRWPEWNVVITETIFSYLTSFQVFLNDKIVE